MLTKRLQKKLDGNYTRMLRAIWNWSRRQHPTRHQLYGHLPPITKTIQVRRTTHAGHCWRSRYELISDVLLWTPTYGCAKAERPARTYIQQLCEDTGCSPEDLPEAMNDREKWRGRVQENETHKILGDFEIQTNHLISAWKPYLVRVEKKKKKEKKLPNYGLCRPDRPKSENQRKRKERQVLRPGQKTKKLYNEKVMAKPIIIRKHGRSLKS